MADEDEDDDFEQQRRRRVTDRYNQLPTPTRKFLEGLRPDEIGMLEEAIRFMRATKTVGRFARWAIVTAVATFVGAVAFGDAIVRVAMWIKDWFNGPPHS